MAATPTENMFRFVQVRMGEYLGIPASQVDFELALGALVEFATKQQSLAFSLLANNGDLAAFVPGATGLDVVPITVVYRREAGGWLPMAV